jgi:hypothetical protein
MCNTIPRILPAVVIMAFSEGVTNKRLVGKLETHNIKTVTKLFTLADKCTWEIEAQSRVERRGIPEEPVSLDPGKPNAKKRKRKAVAAIASEEHNRPPVWGNPLGRPRAAPKADPRKTGGWQVVGDPQDRPA